MLLSLSGSRLGTTDVAYTLQELLLSLSGSRLGATDVAYTLQELLLSLSGSRFHRNMESNEINIKLISIATEGLYDDTAADAVIYSVLVLFRTFVTLRRRRNNMVLLRYIVTVVAVLMVLCSTDIHTFGVVMVMTVMPCN